MDTETLRVLVVHNRYRSAQPSGEDRVVDQEMSLLADAGHQVSLCERRSDDIASASLINRAAVPFRVPWNSAVRRELARRIQREAPHVVHIHNTFPLLSPSVVAACNDTGVPAVATLHNYSMVCPPGTLYRDGHVCTDCAHKLPFPAVRHGCYRDSRIATVPIAVSQIANHRRWRLGIARFLCISHAQRQILIAAGMPAERLAVKHNFVPDPGVRRVDSGEHVLYLGRLTEAKGVRLLIKAWDMMCAGGAAAVPLLVAGAGPLEDELAGWARDRCDVRYLGLRTRAECLELMARATAVVAPSVWPEAFGLVITEAMAVGVPVVAAAHGSFVELVQDGATGLLHRPGDAGSLAECLRRIVVTPALNQAMGHAARQHYERDFTPAVGLERLMAEYSAAMAADGHGPAQEAGQT